MANVKDVHMRFRAPFDWTSEADDQDLAWLGAAFLNPSVGLRLSWRFDGYEDNDHGGRTAHYVGLIEGQEAVAYPWLDRLEDVIARIGEIVRYEVYDVEAGSRASDPSTWERAR